MADDEFKLSEQAAAPTLHTYYSYFRGVIENRTAMCAKYPYFIVFCVQCMSLFGCTGL